MMIAPAAAATTIRNSCPCTGWRRYAALSVSLHLSFSPASTAGPSVYTEAIHTPGCSRVLYAWMGHGWALPVGTSAMQAAHCSAHTAQPHPHHTRIKPFCPTATSTHHPYKPMATLAGQLAVCGSAGQLRRCSCQGRSQRPCRAWPSPGVQPGPGPPHQRPLSWALPLACPPPPRPWRASCSGAGPRMSG